MKLSKSTEGLELIEASIKVFEGSTKSKWQRLYKELCGYLLVMRRNRRRRGICLVKYQGLILSSTSGTRVSPRVLLYIEGDGPDEPPVFQETGLSP